MGPSDLNVVHEKRAPALLILFHKRVTPLIDLEDPKVRFFAILNDLAALQEIIVENRIQHSLETAVAASDLDFRCEHLMSTICNTMHYGSQNYSISGREFPLCYGRNWDCYPNAHVARWRNSMRQTRILLSAITLDQIFFENNEEEALQAQCLERQKASVATTKKMASEICSTVPQFAQEIYEKRSQSGMATLASV